MQIFTIQIYNIFINYANDIGIIIYFYYKITKFALNYEPYNINNYSSI